MQSSVGDDIPGSPDSIRARLDELERRVVGPVDAEVVSVDAQSCGLVLGVLHALWGLVFGLWQGYTAIKIRERLPMAEAREVQLFQDYFMPGLVLAVAGLVVGFLAGLVLAKLYNAAAGSVGGVRVRVRVDSR